MKKNYDLFSKEAKFVAGATKISQFPKINLPEIAFIGKSNVGKSSLINLLCNRSSLARVSNSPGRTQQINFFSVGTNLVLVDLPGYGFSKVPQYLKKQWQDLTLNYFKTRYNLKLVNILIDSRRGIRENDLYIINLLIELNKNFQIVFTKSDKITISDTVKLEESDSNIIDNIRKNCESPLNIIYTSSKSKTGEKALKSSMAKYIE